MSKSSHGNVQMLPYTGEDLDKFDDFIFPYLWSSCLQYVKKSYCIPAKMMLVSTARRLPPNHLVNVSVCDQNVFDAGGHLVRSVKWVESE